MGTSPASNASKKNFEPWLSGKAGTELLKPVATDVLERRSVSSIESTAFLRVWRAIGRMGLATPFTRSAPGAPAANPRAST
jgi:hypothetical protein